MQNDIQKSQICPFWGNLTHFRGKSDILCKRDIDISLACTSCTKIDGFILETFCRQHIYDILGIFERFQLSVVCDMTVLKLEDTGWCMNELHMYRCDWLRYV